MKAIHLSPNHWANKYLFIVYYASGMLLCKSEVSSMSQESQSQGIQIINLETNSQNNNNNNKFFKIKSIYKVLLNRLSVLEQLETWWC